MTDRVLIVGLGRIGMGYDIGLGPGFVLSHARAFAGHEGFELAAGVDPDPSKRSAFTAAYRRPAYPTIDAALDTEKADIVVLAMPTDAHAEQLAAVLRRASPRAILCEKPMAYDLADARAMVASCEARGVRLFVNYFRRSEPGALEIRRRIGDGRIAGPLKGVAWYSKGLLHNGSHFFNILLFWLGPMLESRLIADGRQWTASDPEPDAIVRFARGTVLFLAAREEEFSYCAVELIGTNGRLRYDRGGDVIGWTPRAAEVQDNGCRELVADPQPIDTGMDRYQWHVADQLRATLDGADAEICTGAEALATLEGLHTIIAMRKTT